MAGHHERLLGQARADLAQLPDLVDQLPDPTERHHDVTTHGSGKIIGSPSPLNMPVVHLVDTRRKPGWELEDPRYTRMADWLGIAPLLEQWVRVLCEELGPDRPELTEHATVRSEASVLVEYWDFIAGQPWATDLARDATHITGQVRAVLGIRPEPKYTCPRCGNDAYLQPGGILACVEVQDHQVVVRDLEQQQRRRPPMTSKDIAAEFGITLAQLWQWKHRRRISPAKTEQGKHWWLPWDVFCLVNPDIAEAIERRHAVAADDSEQDEADVP